MRIYRKNWFLFGLILGLAVWMQVPVVGADDCKCTSDCKCTNCPPPKICKCTNCVSQKPKCTNCVSPKTVKTVPKVVGGGNPGPSTMFTIVQGFMINEGFTPAQLEIFIRLGKRLQSEEINLDQFVDMQHQKEEIPQADIDAFKRFEKFRQSEGIPVNQLVEMQPRFRVQEELRMRELEVVPELTRELKVVPELTQELRVIEVPVETPAQFK